MNVKLVATTHDEHGPSRLLTPALLRESLTCYESLEEGDCGRPATHLVGVMDDDMLGVYPACSRCSRFWMESSRWPLASLSLEREDFFTTPKREA